MRYYQLLKAPLCAFCLRDGRTTAATIADHIKPHKGVIELFYDEKNLQSLCKACHDSEKKRIELGSSMGYDVHGNPILTPKHWR